MSFFWRRNPFNGLGSALCWLAKMLVFRSCFRNPKAHKFEAQKRIITCTFITRNTQGADYEESKATFIKETAGAG